jgi:hypothetical protein
MRIRRILTVAAVTGALVTGLAGTASAAADPTATCRDGSVSYSASRSGTCSHHGGVATWRNRAPARSNAPAPGGWDCRTMGNWVCGPGQPYAAGYYVQTRGGPVLVAPWAM